VDRPARVSRLLEMVSLLQSRPGWKAETLARRFGVSTTRIYSDIRALREAGVPVRRAARGYAIDPSFFLPSVRLTPREVLTLLFPQEVFTGAQADHEVFQAARAKLLSLLPEPLRESARKLLESTDVRPRVFQHLRQAVAERRRVSLLYSGRKSDELRRIQVDPYALAFRRHAWYLVGMSAAHGEVRKFRVSRIAAVEDTPLHFTVPRDFNLEDHFNGAWFVFEGEPREVAIKFSPSVARLIRDRALHREHSIQTLSDGTVIYRAVVRNLDEVAWWLVQYGEEAVVLEPPELREKVIRLAAGVLRANGVRLPKGYPEAGAEEAPRVAEHEPPARKSIRRSESHPSDRPSTR